MMTQKERTRALHARMQALRQARERQKTGAIGAASAVLSVCLLWMVFGGQKNRPGSATGLYSGATMLFEEAGPYVLLAVVAFMAGVVAAVSLIKSRKQPPAAQKNVAAPQDQPFIQRRKP